MNNTLAGPGSEEIINYTYLKKAAIIIRALNNPLRQKIFNYLAETGISTVTDIIAFCDVEQSMTSQHLAILRRAKIISNLRNGKYVHYYINQGRVAEIQFFLHSLLEDPKFSKVVDLHEN